jgi:TonB family protein
MREEEQLMMVESILLFGLSLALTAQSPTPPAPQQSACAQASADALTDGAAGEICAGDEAVRLANAAPTGSAARARQLEAAAGHYRKAATAASKPTTKVLALNLLAGSYDVQHLNDPQQMETTLREVISLTPGDFAPVYRLAKLQEDEGFIDAAEETLLDARHKQPDAVEPNRMLAQFYARLVTALHKQEAQKEPQAASNPGGPDENGIYRVGGSITPPARDDVPQYPDDAKAAGIKGVVVAEVVIDASGNVTDTKVVQSIPLLDETALRAVSNWHFAPTLVNGQPVPVRMNVNVNFSLPPAPPSSAPPPPRR